MRYSIQNRYIWLPLLCLTPLMEGFPWENLRKIFPGCQRMAKVPNTVEILPKISIAWVGRTSITDDRQTDERQHIVNVNASSRSLKTARQSQSTSWNAQTCVWKLQNNSTRNGGLLANARTRFSAIVHATSSSCKTTSFLRIFMAYSSSVPFLSASKT